jgi:hypothetical protein
MTRTIRGERGQAATEYLMISGLITAMGILILGYMQSPLRRGMQCVTEFVIGQALDPPFEGFSPGGLVCGGGVGPLGGFPGGGGGGLGGLGGGGFGGGIAHGEGTLVNSAPGATGDGDLSAAVSTVPPLHAPPAHAPAAGGNAKATGGGY